MRYLGFDSNADGRCWSWRNYFPIFICKYCRRKRKLQIIIIRKDWLFEYSPLVFSYYKSGWWRNQFCIFYYSDSGVIERWLNFLCWRWWWWWLFRVPEPMLAVANDVSVWPIKSDLRRLSEWVNQVYKKNSSSIGLCWSHMKWICDC